jgi:hypothetical protein
MANTSADSWDIASPANGDSVSNAALEMRVLREGVANRINKEHADIATAGVGGEHAQGSGMAYYAAVAPTLRPDGITAFTSADTGRLYLKSGDGTFWVYNGTSFIQVKVDASGIIADAVTTTKILDLAVTAGKLADTLDLSGKTITLPTSQTLTTPTIADFTNANHTHGSATQGGTISQAYAYIEEWTNSMSGNYSEAAFYGAATVAATTWYTRHLMNERTGDAAFCTLNGVTGTFTLSVGRYKVTSFCTSADTESSRLKTRIYNISTGATAATGSSFQLYTGGNTMAGIACLIGFIDVASAAHVYALQAYCSTAHYVGFGNDSTEKEVFSSLELLKIRDV